MLRATVKLDILVQRLIRILLLVYPLVAHVAIMLDQAIWAAAYLLVVVFLNSLKFISHYRYIKQSISVLLFAVLIYILFHIQHNLWVIYLPPVLTPAWLAFVFLGSMWQQQAFISQIAEKIEGKSLDSRHLHYTRWLTVIWGSVFILMICEAVLLAIFASFEVWSWWVHIGNYIIVVTLFLIEFISRPFFIGQRVHIGRMVKQLVRQNWHEYKDK